MEAFSIGSKSNNRFIISEETVSGTHAEVKISPDFKVFTLVDLDSTNGTKVNGQPILEKKIKETDVLEFGDKKINTQHFFTKLKAYIIENREDFSKEFAALEGVAENYSHAKYNVKKYFKLKSVLIRVGFTLLIIILIYNISALAEYKQILAIIVGLIGTVVSTISVSEKDVNQKLGDLYVEFSENFVCPKCKYDLSAKDNWKFWRSKKKCPKCRCIWVSK